MNATQLSAFIVPLNTGPNYFLKHLPLTSKGGVERTAGMKSGFIHLEPDDEVSWHTTGSKEEMLIILRGEATVKLGTKFARPMTVTGPAAFYIPPETGHSVRNNGTEALEYVYVVAALPAAPRVLQVHEGGPGWEGSRPG